MPFVLFGLWRARKRAPLALWVLLPPVACFWALALIGSTTPRYRYPIEPALFLLAAFGIASYLADSKTRRWHMGIAIPWVFCNLLAIGFSDQAKFAIRTILESAGVW